jgi:hypothetical protein
MQAEHPWKERVTARIIFEGLYVMWLNPWGDMEVGFVNCPNHKFSWEICKIKSGAPVNCNPDPCEPEMKSEIPELPAFPNIDCRALGATKYKQVGLYQPGPAFDRRAGGADDAHFRWMFDLQGSELHQNRAGINPGQFSARMRINSGLVYTMCQSNIELDLKIWLKEKDPGWNVGRFGKVAEKTAVNIVCDAGKEQGIWWEDSRQKPVWLASNPDITYEISVKNLCEQPVDPAHTDFRQFYLSGVVVCPPDEPKYDFCAVLGPPSVPQPACNGVYGGP